MESEEQLMLVESGITVEEGVDVLEVIANVCVLVQPETGFTAKQVQVPTGGVPVNTAVAPVTGGAVAWVQV
jgi:hypothetical protein